MKKILLFLAIVLVISASIAGGASQKGLIKSLEQKLHLSFNWLGSSQPKQKGIENERVVYQESVITDVVAKTTPSVVTVGIKKTTLIFDPFENLFDPFNLTPPSVQKKKIEQNIGSGFIVSKDGLIITNKHVVSDTQASYKVITNNNKEYKVEKIYRDPLFDLAILKINATNLKPLELGNSDKLKLGQMAIAIGTALGQFKNTVTVGVISGLGRGIVAGDGLGEVAEKLDNVIQTDAAINPGNSGGPLLNSAGQVIGVNVAMAAGAQNIGFAIPINTVKEVLKTFETTGKFNRPYLGVRYKMISQRLAILNEVPEGAYVVDVLGDSPAAKAGIEKGDIITKVDGQAVREKNGGLVRIIQHKKVGQEIKVELWRDGKTKTVTVHLEASKS